MRGNKITPRTGKDNPNYKHGLRQSRLFSIWSNMKTRCYNPKFSSYHRYGGRGITVCEEWLQDFKTFYDWAIDHGYEDHLTLDRINNNGNYEPNNCRWTDAKTQAANRENLHFVTREGITLPLNVWARQLGINPKTVRDRLKRGWDYERALTEPPQTKYRRECSYVEP